MVFKSKWLGGAVFTNFKFDTDFCNSIQGVDSYLRCIYLIRKLNYFFMHCCELLVSSSIMSKSIRFLLLVSANFLLIVLLNLKHSKNI